LPETLCGSGFRQVLAEPGRVVEFDKWLLAGMNVPVFEERAWSKGRERDLYDRVPIKEWIIIYHHNPNQSAFPPLRMRALPKIGKGIPESGMPT